MSTKYTFGQTDKGFETGFDFSVVINDQVMVYTAKYPTPKQIRPIQTGYRRLQELDKEYSQLGEDDAAAKKKIEKEVEKIGKEIAETFSNMFIPAEGSLPVEEMLDNLTANQKRQFDKMVADELFS